MAWETPSEEMELGSVGGAFFRLLGGLIIGPVVMLLGLILFLLLLCWSYLDGLPDLRDGFGRRRD